MLVYILSSLLSVYMKLFVYSQFTCIFVSSKKRLQWYSSIPYASSAQPRRPLSCITLHFGMGFVYLLQLTVEKLYKKLVYSDGIGHLKVNWNYIFIYIIYFFFLVQAQNIKQLRPWFHPKWPYCIEKKIQDTGTITIQIYYLEVYQNSLQKTNALNPDQWICNTVRRLKNLFTEQPHIYPVSERGLVYKTWWGSRVGYK